jgi:hypothetical protein
MINSKSQAKKDDLKFIALLTKLFNTPNLTHEVCNKLITKAYPNLEFLENKKSNVFIRPLVFWKIKNMDDNRDTIEQIFKLIDDVYPKLYLNKSTLDNLYTSDVRQPVAKRWPSPTGKKGDDHEYYKLVKEMVALPDDIKGALLKDAKDKGTQKLKNQTVIDMEEILNIIKTNLVSVDPMRRAVALLICCGSRTIEFFSKSSYKPYKFDENKHWATQTFIAKKRGDSTKTDTVIKPIIYLTAEKFIAERNYVLEQLYSKYPKYNKSFITIDKDKEKLASVIVDYGNKIAKEVFSNREGFTMHTCRALYAIISYDMFGQKKSPHGDKSEFRQWISDVLGKEGDDSATRQYAKFVLSHKLNVSEIPAKTEQLEKKIENLEERMDNLNINVDEKPLPTVIVKNARSEKQIRLVSELFEKYVKDNGKEPTQTHLETLAKSVAPRRIVRLFMKFHWES